MKTKLINLRDDLLVVQSSCLAQAKISAFDALDGDSTAREAALQHRARAEAYGDARNLVADLLRDLPPDA